VPGKHFARIAVLLTQSQSHPFQEVMKAPPPYFSPLLQNADLLTPLKTSWFAGKPFQCWL